MTGAGALAGVRVIEMPAIGPVPFAATMLADHGAQVLRIVGPRPDLGVVDPAKATHLRGRPSLRLDLKQPEQREVLLDLVGQADILLEGFRPGTLERLDLEPDTLLARRPSLVIGRMTGWGQTGPLSQRAGHDINYIALAGALRSFAREGQAPVPPVNLVGDYGGGAMFLLFGVLAALHRATATGQGQVVDAAMVDGTATLMSLVYSMAGQGLWPGEPGKNLLDTGAPFYDVYRCAGGGYVAVGCLEPQFYAAFLDGLGIAADELPAQYDPTGWPVLRDRFTEALASQTRDHWTAIFEGTDACVTAVLDYAEAPDHAHLRSRGTFTDRAGVVAPGVAPRLDVTPGQVGHISGPATAEQLRDWGLGQQVAEQLADPE